jgi:F-type H+-transporting ATPase subunit epsilon
VSSLRIDIVSAVGQIFSGRAALVIAQGSEGQLGIAPRHAPLLTRLVPGEIRVLGAAEHELVFFVTGGILEVQPHHVTVLGDTVLRGQDINEAAAAEARSRAEQALRGAVNKADLDRAERDLIEAQARYRVLERWKRVTKADGSG